MSDAIGVELAQLAREIWDWQRETFGDGCTVHGAVAKIRDECAEVLECETRLAERRAVRRAGRREELADVFFMLVQLAGAAGCATALRCAVRVPGMRRDAAMSYALGMVDAYAHASMHARGAMSPIVEAAVDAWLDACHANGDLPHMPAAIRAKLEENRSRTWAKPAADGTISHVKPAPKGGE